MQTDRPTVELYFIFAFTYCKLRVYEEQKAFACRILESHDVEFIAASASESWQEIDTRVLLDLVSEALPGMICNIFPQPDELLGRATTTLGIQE